MIAEESWSQAGTGGSKKPEDEKQTDESHAETTAGTLCSPKRQRLVIKLTAPLVDIRASGMAFDVENLTQKSLGTHLSWQYIVSTVSL